MFRFRARGLAPIAVALLVTTSTGAHAQSSFTLGGVTAAPGSLSSGDLKVPGGAGDEGTVIPFTLIHGSQPGPVLALIAGTHGVEYPPVLALQRLSAWINPQALRGTI